MKAYIEINKNDGLPINVDVQLAVDGLIYLGYDILTFSKEDVETMRLQIVARTGEVPFIGSINTITRLLKHIGKYPTPLDFPTEIIESGLMNRPIFKMKLNDAICSFRSVDYSVPMFIKPVETKLFDGILISKESQLNYFNGLNNPDIFMSDKINIVSEYRCYVHKGKLIYGCNYSGDFRVGLDYSYVDKLIKVYIDCPVSYTIDVAVLEDGKHTVIEVNDFWSIGGYGLSCYNYAEMLVDRWKEIIKG